MRQFIIMVEAGEKFSKHGQWQERSNRPTNARPMSKDDIEEHRQNLVASYQCDPGDITVDFERIFDENDSDRDDCIWLRYRMKCVVKGKQELRNIFSIKVPIPDHIRKVAEQMRREQAKQAASRQQPVSAAQVYAQNASTPPPSGNMSTVVNIEEVATEAPRAPPVATEAPRAPAAPTVTDIDDGRPKLRRPVRPQ